MPTRRVKLIYPARLVEEPILYQITRQFDIVTSVRRASLEEDGGVLELDLRGDDMIIDRALEWVRGLGIEVAQVQ
jgi:L-aspartate semialdehyde sulfurtransferase ferredoxin